MTYYHLSIGSNINPEENIKHILKMLCRDFGEIVVFPPISTHPENIKTNLLFVNSIAIISTTLTEPDLKEVLNKIETILGRDKNDPMSARKDRTADIDILSKNQCFSIGLIFDIQESYVKSVLYPNPNTGSTRTDILPIETPATINIDRRTGDIKIINQIPYP
jgi:2-amino-4-hydroxy-6-hydroxymethyldihydropteridine diphosphokinase